MTTTRPTSEIVPCELHDTSSPKSYTTLSPDQSHVTYLSRSLLTFSTGPPLSAFCALYDPIRRRQAKGPSPLPPALLLLCCSCVYRVAHCARTPSSGILILCSKVFSMLLSRGGNCHHESKLIGAFPITTCQLRTQYSKPCLRISHLAFRSAVYRSSGAMGHKYVVSE